MSSDQKAVMLLPPIEKFPTTSIRKLLFLPKFYNSSPSVTQDKDICCMIMSYWHHYLLRWSTQWNPFNDAYPLFKFDVPSFSMTGDIWIFKLVILLPLSSSKLIFILLTLGKKKLTLFIPFYWLWTSHCCFPVFGQDMLQ